MDKHPNAKKEAFKKLLGEMMKESAGLEHYGEEYGEMEGSMGMMEEMAEEAPMKATIMAEDKEGLIEGAKKLPEALSKAEEYMRKEIGMDAFDEAEKQANKKKKRK